MPFVQRCWTVGRVVLGDRVTYRGEELVVAPEALLGHFPQEVATFRLHLVPPGARVRVLDALDAVPLLAEGSGPGVFPGWLGPQADDGHGAVDLLRGVHILTAGSFPGGTTGVRGPRPAVLDKSGPLAPYCYGADEWSLLIQATPRPGVANGTFDDALRAGSLRAARALAREAVLSAGGDGAARFDAMDLGVDRTAPTEAVPVVVALQLQDQGPLIRCYLYGNALGPDFYPTIVQPGELARGCLVSGNFRSQMKMPTAMLCDHPLVRAARREEAAGRMRLAGVIVSRGHNADIAQKTRSAHGVARLAQSVGARGAVLGMEGTGNATIDYMLTVQALEQRGIRTVGVLHELGGPDGREASLVDSVPEADALISTGNCSELIDVPPLPILTADPFLRHAGGQEFDMRLPQRLAANECYGGLWQMACSGFRSVDW